MNNYIELRSCSLETKSLEASLIRQQFEIERLRKVAKKLEKDIERSASRGTERRIEKEEEAMNLDLTVKESIHIARSEVGYAYGKMQSAACILAGEVERLRATISCLDKEITKKDAEIERLQKTVHKYKTGGLRR